MSSQGDTVGEARGNLKVRIYYQHQILGEKYKIDMLHIALATIADVDIIVSWNFKHKILTKVIKNWKSILRERLLIMETIKAVEMIRQIRDSEYKITKNMSDEALKNYFHNNAKLVNDEALKFIKKQLPGKLKRLDKSNNNHLESSELTTKKL